MEEVVSHHIQKQGSQLSAHKFLQSRNRKDLWIVVREGTVTEVESALVLIKKTGGNINLRNTVGLTPLHIATWRNHVPIVKRLLAAGADPNARDGESGWSSLHRALHFGHLAVASILLQAGASTILEDLKFRTPVDLLSGPAWKGVEGSSNSVTTEVYSWGSGVNYQLGTGNAHIQKLPCKVDSLHGSLIRLISASKFHSVAVSACGEVYTWGFGRGGRLGHPDFDIHSGQAAVITPRLVTSGLGHRRVKSIAAAKHHTVASTEGGEVFTWGSNREGQLGYTSVDTQPTPRRVSSLKSKVVAVAAANKHSAVVSESGEVFTWGCNKEGQLGYGTSNSASNYTPRLVDYLKGKVFVGVSAAKYHTIVLGADGEVFTWGHRLVTPRRVIIARNLKKSGAMLKFHRKERLHVVAIAAGMVHSLALTDDGTLFYWVSSDPNLRCQQLYSLSGRPISSISAGKYWTAAVTTTGDVYMWDAKQGKGEPPVATRLLGVKKATSVSVGETHLLVISSLYHPVYPPSIVKSNQKIERKVYGDLDELDEDFMFNDTKSDRILCTVEKDEIGSKPIPTLKSLCEKVAAESMVEPRNVLQLLEIADTLGADDLRKHCEDIAIRNIDYILTVSSHAMSSTSLDVLVNLEKVLDARSSETWSHRRLPTPTATFPAIINSEEDDSESEFFSVRGYTTRKGPKIEGDHRLDYFAEASNSPNQDIMKQVRTLRKKLQQIDMLEEKQSKGHALDDQQIAKVQTRIVVESCLAELGVPVEKVAERGSSPSVDGKGSKKADVSKKQRRKSKHKVAMDSSTSIMDVVSDSGKGFIDNEFSRAKLKDEEAKECEERSDRQVSDEIPCMNDDLKEIQTSINTSVTTSKKKKNKKGGLSMFLSGALDDNPKKDVPPPTPPIVKTEGPVWGGAKVSKVPSSLREIQDEQNKTTGSRLSKPKGQMDDLSDGKNSVKIKLSSFLPSSPIVVASARTPQASDGDKTTPLWTASGTPPLLSRPSLRDIQIQQGKNHQSLSHSPKTKTTGFTVTTGQGSPSDSAGMNRWFKPEVDSPSSLRSIQIEEKAMKDLKRFYTSVKIVKPC